VWFHEIKGHQDGHEYCILLDQLVQMNVLEADRKTKAYLHRLIRLPMVLEFQWIFIKKDGAAGSMG